MNLLTKADIIFENFNPHSKKSENEVSDLYWACISKTKVVGDEYFLTAKFCESISKIYGLVI